ncbi:quinone oxidoreductase-like protein 1 [Schistocerca americana]|uniref:quinone oxidoreductase-like protein 1 n=1 Tax=Schistocerca americana TaxID=7009 RepID=UPI001F4FC20E|nr:quinone oxidoreductase-like protein 1 [Schistocerca americana]XP_047098113.1 quinone oxidoreductase-like protein 1 [Schistocerca piceifrons]XP_049943114.1 quinone oxidoreductase-like protein 1 [Schistocerca serialis cubense]
MPRPKSAKSVFIEKNDSCVPRIFLEEVTLPDLEKNGILIEVKACGLPDTQFDHIAVMQILARANKKQFMGLGFDISGVVQAVGSDVTTLKVGDQVVGVVPLDYEQSGCSEYVVVQEFDVVLKPDDVSFVDAAACIGDAVKAYTALHYLGKLNSGDTVLIIDGASSFGSICVQLAHHWGARVLTTATSDDEKAYLQGPGRGIAHVVEVGTGGLTGQAQRSSSTSSLRSGIMLETGNLGVDIIVDRGGLPFLPEDQQNINNNVCDNRWNSTTAYSPTKHEIISCLGVGGRWVTSKANLQLDPPYSRMLYLRCASVGFLFEQSWILSNAQQGRYQHILMDIVEKIKTGIVRPNIHHTVSFESVLEEVKLTEELRVGKVVMTRS